MLTKAIGLKPDYAEAYLLRGETLLSAGETAEADEDACRLLKEHPDNEDILMLKARIEKAKGNPAEAISYYSRVIDANPFNANAYRERGLLRIDNGDEGCGQADLKQAEELAEQQNTGNEKQNIENETKEKYKSIDPYGVFS